MPRRTLVVALALLASACGQSGGNPFSASSPSRAPSPSASILFVSGSWTNEVGRPRELLAVAADGSGFEQLTNCARAAQPCDILQVAPSPDRNRVVAVRTTPDAEAGAQVLFFMDLARSVESVLFARRRVEFADWSRDGSFLLYSSITGQTGNEDMFTAGPDGTNEQNLTDSLNVRERSGRIDPSGRTAAFERVCTVRRHLPESRRQPRLSLPRNTDHHRTRDRARSSPTRRTSSGPTPAPPSPPTRRRSSSGASPGSATAGSARGT